MKFFPHRRFFYVSPWLLAAAATLLVLIVLTFSLSNIKREKQIMTNAMTQKAATLIRIVHSGARAAFLSDLKRGIWKPDPWDAYVQRVINHVSEDPEVRFLAVVDERDKIIAHNDEQYVGRTLNHKLPSHPNVDHGGLCSMDYRIVYDKDHGRIFEAVELFIPSLSSRRMMMTFSRRKQHGRVPFFGKMLPGQLFQYRFPDGPDLSLKYYVLVGLDMSVYDRSLRRLRVQALILSLTMLLVGLGGWLSLAAVQGYRVSQKTLGDIRAFTGLLIARLPVGIIATDREGRVTTWNAATAAMTGIQKEQAFGRLPDEVLPAELAGFFSQEGSLDSLEENEQGKEKEISVTFAGRKQFLLCHVISVRNHESMYMGQVLLVSNMTELKGLDKKMRENERLAAVGRMAAGVAHEVRNPLSSIKGLALLLKGKFVSDSREGKTAELLIQEVERMNRTISELLSFARPAPLNVRRTDLAELLDDEIRLVDSDARSRGIEIRLQFADGLLPVAADRDRIKQVFINIMLNGLQAMDSGGILFVTAENSELESTVVVTVKDTGCGIDEDSLNQIFYPYFTTKPGGTGIGLAISQKIVSDHGGAIRIDSVAGQGTTVTVELPVFSETGSNVTDHGVATSLE